MALHSIFIVSIPRSGSTLLTTLLDSYADMVCPPESLFPAILELLEDSEMRDRRKVAALFVASCSDGSPLTLEEAETCIYSDKHETLDALALAIARKLGRDPGKIRIAVWKFTRMVGCWKFAAGIGGRFIILHRNLLNVYESQFRVPFGVKNKNPFRFALFATSYGVAFAEYPKDQTIQLDYAEIPTRIDSIVAWVGSPGRKREASAGSLDAIAEKKPWHANINKPFENLDAEKARNLTFPQSTGFQLSYALFNSLGFITRKARITADRRQMAALRQQAQHLLGR